MIEKASGLIDDFQGQTQLLFRQAVARLRSENGTLVECALDVSWYLVLSSHV